MNSVTAERSHQIRDSRAVACADRAREMPFDAQHFDDEGYAEHIIRPEAAFTRDIAEKSLDNDEHRSRIYLAMNADLHTESDAWKARRLEELVADWHESSEIIAREELETL